MLKTHKKPDRALYVFPARRMIKEHDSDCNSDTDATHTNTANTTITHQYKQPESSPNRQQRSVLVANRDQANDNKILANKFNNNNSPNRQQFSVSIANKDHTNNYHNVLSIKLNNNSPNKQQRTVLIANKNQANGYHKDLLNTLNNKSSPNHRENVATKEIGQDCLRQRRFGRARQLHSNSPETNRYMTAGRGRMLSLMKTYLKMESEFQNGGKVHGIEAASLKSEDACDAVNQNQQRIHNNSYPISSPNGVLRNKRENTRILGVGKVSLAKKSTVAERDKKSPRVSPDGCLLMDPDISVEQFESCDQEEEAQQQKKEKCLLNDKISSLPDNSKITKKPTVENKPVLSWAEEMKEFDRLHLNDNTNNNNTNVEEDKDVYGTSLNSSRKSVEKEKENQFCHTRSPENHISYEANNYSPNENQYLDYGGNRHHSKHRINTRWRRMSNEANGSNFNSKNRTSNFVVNGNQISQKDDLQHKISSIKNTGTISPYRNKQALLSNPDHAKRITKTWEESFLSRCSAAGYKFFDTHCHLDRIFDDLKSKSEKVFSNFKEFKEENWTTFPKEFVGCLTVFCDPWKFDPKGILLRNFMSARDVWVAMGCHPKKVRHFTGERMQQLRDCLIQMPSIVAVGEIGLDYSGTFYQQVEDQKRALRDQIRLAVEMIKPIIIHCREAEDDCLRIFLEECPQNWPIHLHCYTNAYSSAQKWLNAFPSLYIGLTPKVTYKSSTALHDTAHKIPLDRLLLETDAPYFIPSMVPHNAIVTSHPGMAFSVAETVADLKNINVKEVLKSCLENTQKLYGIKL